ncbi:Rhodanese-like protein [Basidiobolus meristosporus CBS 931.73]|uniref:Rhodanese-like protein n=1 Tax=Basidiobolus meristosporus CBS 931.73 TaxID=1314790 RepID=A0A1Y1X6I1_9FUNG|nr:Rhodanese-like protein [Basidiobolus meristosporus CBS 931.73]|eukprot:ORX81401.1 Rhodanese-like protein [Basidiobolus meristosporus CBS 931.73]
MTFSTINTNPTGSLWPTQGTEITYEGIQTLIAHPPETRGILLIDVRGREEFLQGHIPTSVNLPLDELEKALHLSDEEFFRTYQFQPPKPHSRIVVSCRSGSRSTRAHKWLLEAGFQSVLNYPGGWIEFSTRQPARE